MTVLNKYEGMFLLDHGKVKNEVQKGIDAISEVLKKHGASIHKIGKWDERKLAYEIKNQKRGTYILAHFEAESPAVKEINHDFNLSEVVSRHIVVRLRKKFPPFMTAQEIDAQFGNREGRIGGSGGGGGGGGRRGRDDEGIAAQTGDMGMSY